MNSVLHPTEERLFVMRNPQLLYSFEQNDMDIQDYYLLVIGKCRTLLRQVNFTRSKLNETHGINIHTILYNVIFPFVATHSSPL